MIKKFSLLIILITALCITASASEVRPADIRFTPDGGGKFIYCNNHEKIGREHLADRDNPNPEYLMNNDHLTADKYAMYVSHLNQTELKDENGNIIETGFDIEVDVQFKAHQDTTVSLTAIGFEIPKIDAYYENGNIVKTEYSWGCMNAIADYTQRPIYELHSGERYMPRDFTPVSFTVKAGESVWLSEFIENYAGVPWLKPVLIVADFEILEGDVDINVAALKSNGNLRDRSTLSTNAARGRYYRDRQYKGIADTLPSVTTKEMQYTIDDLFVSGTKLPVTVYNQFRPEGNTLTTWFTNLNPQTDIWARYDCAESDMLQFKYEDETKLDYYGPGVSALSRDTTWVVDVFHSDTADYPGADSGYNSFNYVPNYPLTTTLENNQLGCNLGNYGVNTNYKIKIQNLSNKTWYFNYRLKTTSNNVVNIKDENGEYMTPYSVCKGPAMEQLQDTLAVVELKPHKTTTFYLEVMLPMNYPGGMNNTFVVTDAPMEIPLDNPEREKVKSSENYTGKEYYKWENRNLYTSVDLENWQVHYLTTQTKDIFDQNWGSYEIKSAGNKYFVKCSMYSSGPSYYQGVLNYFNTVYFLDKDFNLTGKYTFDSFPTDITYAKGKYFVKTEYGSFYSSDETNWKPFEGGYNPPVDNGREFCIATKDGNIYASADGLHYEKISYTGDAPDHVSVAGDVYYYTKGNTIHVSRNGSYWQEIEHKEKVRTVDGKNGMLLINNTDWITLPDLQQDITVSLNGQMLTFGKPPIMVEDTVLVPMRAIFESLGARVYWDEETESAYAMRGNEIIQFTIGSLEAKINGFPFKLLAAPIMEQDTTMVPVRFLAEGLGYDVTWDKDINNVSITAVKDNVSDLVQGTIPENGLVPDEKTALEIAESILRAAKGFTFIQDNGPLEAAYQPETDAWVITGKDGTHLLSIRCTDGKILYFR